MGEFSTTQGPPRCGKVATTQAGGTWHLEPAQIGQILLLGKFKIEQIEPISCHFQSILTLQWENFLNPRSNQVWAGGHHPSRWHLAPETSQNRSNLVPLHVQNQANLTYFMSILSILNPKRDPKWSGGEFICNSRSNQVWAGGHHPSRWHLAPATCPNKPYLVPRQVQN